MAQFRAKARAVELLGKGQISDLPTAISELWKNGYDAYGSKLEAFLYLNNYEGLKKPLFIISDDGKGMTRNDILDKWIVLGTDSKSRNEEEKKGEETLWKEPRIKMGEKGIGRLSVAYLGTQMLMLTKKIGSPLQAVFFDWQILENYNQFLEEINIPVRSVDSKKGFKDLFNELKTEYLSNFRNYKEPKEDPWYDQLDVKETIIKGCKSIELPSFFEDEILESLIGTTKEIHGTKFIIFNPDPQLLLLDPSIIDKKNQEEVDEGTVNYIRAGLTGLFNVFKEKKPEYSTNFWIIDNNGKYDFIDKREFFDFHEFKTCDHLIEGTFDETCTFNGSLRIFEKTIKHRFKPNRLVSNSSYGPFNIKLGYVQAEHGFETPILKGDERKNFYNKLELFGGIYIYRDGFRVLPYGRPEYDFLEFEKRRSKKAGYYFFSHRRMFGYIEISRTENKKLTDKAGREGFINNAAYRDFKKDLEDFFIDLAKTYFATDAKSDIKEEQQSKYEELIANEKLEHEKDKIARKEFASQLKMLPTLLSEIEGELDTLIKELEIKKNQSNIVYSELEGLLSRIEECKIKAEGLKISSPARFKPTELQKKNYHAYKKSYEKFQKETLKTSNKIIDDVRERLKEQELLNEFNNRIKQYSTTLGNLFEEYRDQLNTIFGNLGAQLLNEREFFVSDFEGKIQELQPKAINQSEIKQSLKLVEKVFIDSRDKVSDRIGPFIKHLEKVSFDVNEDDLVGYFKIKYEEMQEEWEKTRELAQLGIAVEIIDHQFNVLYSQLATSIGTFADFIKDNSIAKKNYETLKNAFEHLESNYKLLQPLYRTTGRIRKDITGLELFDYANVFFSEQFKDKNISFSISNSAKALTIFSYESIFKPVLVNIINNAIYWLQSVSNKKLEIDAIGDELLIRNSGEPIEDIYIEDIFKLFYSKRSKGRGIGLYLAKTSLNANGYDIIATNDPKYNKLNGACFVIKPIMKK
ncbi:MAG TPA: ATP-binding protein [Bacteroidia bacterium]|nr:ATP-binding protein [Bacteroidia bacterium]